MQDLLRGFHRCSITFRAEGLVLYANPYVEYLHNPWLCDSQCTMSCNVVVYEEKIRSQITSKQMHVRQKNIDRRVDTRGLIAFKNVEVRTVTKHDCTP